MKKFQKCCSCGKFMRKIYDEWTPAGILLHYECTCGGYVILGE